MQHVNRTCFTLRMAIREINILSCLTKMSQNKYTTHLYEVRHFKNAQDQMEVFLVLEYLPSDLKTIFLRPDSYTKESAKLIMFNTLKALSFIHKANLLHRDIKPANILVDENCNVKLCDFGLARSLPKSRTQKGSGNTKRLRDSLFKKG